MSRSVPIQKSLRRNLVLIIMLLGAAVMGATFFVARHISERMAKSLTSQTIAQADQKLGRFFDPIANGLRVARDWGREGLLDIKDADKLNAIFTPLMRAHPQVSSMLIASASGDEHMVLRVNGVWNNRLTRREEWGPRVRWRQWTDDVPAPVEEWRDIDYDPRRRPWFQGAIDETMAGRAGVIHWTAPYIFFTTRDPGITASLTFIAPDGQPYVVGFDVLLRDIARFASELNVSEDGAVLILTDTNEIISQPTNTNGAEPPELDEPPHLPTTADLDLAFLTPEARQHLSETPRNGPFRYDVDGRSWWGEVHPFRLSDTCTLRVAVFVPESDLLGAFWELRGWVIGATLVVLVFGYFRATAIARRFSQPIEALMRQAERIRHGDLDKREPIHSSVTEVRRLASAQDRMRVAVRSLLKLESDLRLAQEIQHDTFPERLPKLDGFSIATWTESAEETSGDTYDVIGFRAARGETPAVIENESAERAFMLMADATGHGVGPALSVMQVRAMLRMAVRTGADIAAIARHMNEQFYADLHEGRFITAWLGELNADRHTLTSFSAGQAPLLHYRAQAEEFRVLTPDSLPFGIIDDLVVDLKPPIAMAPGDLFLVMSDGVFEAPDPSGEEFGQERVMDVVRQHATRPPTELIARLREAIHAFTRSAPPVDDRTVIVIRRDDRK